MSIRLRLTLLYSAILSLTLIVFGLALYAIQARSTLDALKSDLQRSGNMVAEAMLWRYEQPAPQFDAQDNPPPRVPNPDDQPFKDLREREIVRVLDPQGDLVVSPLGSAGEPLPLSAEGRGALEAHASWWEISSETGERLFIYNRPVISQGQLVYIVQAARSLHERDRSLSNLGLTLLIAGLVTTVIAFGIGWALSGAFLRPIHRITQTARAIENDNDLARRVNYSGPNDEVGQLATTFNSMLARLQSAYLRLSHSLKMQREFVADVSHELRTPLTTIRGNLALLQRKPALPHAEQDDILSDMVEESDRLIRLVNELLVLARADSGRSLVQEAVPLKPVIEEACRQARNLDQNREIAEHVQDATALGDRDAIKQVLLILLDNALKHTGGAIEVSARPGDGDVEVQVRDQGPGMSPEVVERLFDRFYRGEEDPGVPGFGLGLSIAKALVEGQGGRITIESEPERGSAVLVRLPLLPAP